MIEEDRDRKKLEDSKKRENQLTIAKFLLSKSKDPERIRELRKRINENLQKIEDLEDRKPEGPNHSLLSVIKVRITGKFLRTRKGLGSSISNTLKKLNLPLLGGEGKNG